MGCHLRIAGENLAVDDLIASSSLNPVWVYRRGEPRYPRRHPDGPFLEESGANFDVSNADFGDVDAQIVDAIKFLEEHSHELARMRNFAGVRTLTLDFGIQKRDVVGQFDRFPAKLLRLAGNLDIDLEISLYDFEE